MDDVTLIQLLKSGDKNAFQKLFVKYYSPLVEYASRFIVNEEAEEIVEGFMVHLWEHRKHLNINKSLKSYLFSAVKNRCLNTLKRHRHHQHIYIHHIADHILEPHSENTDYLLIQELNQQIENAIAQLPEKYRETFMMSRFSEATNREIADQLGVSIKTVEYRITQSLKILRKKLKDYL